MLDSPSKCYDEIEDEVKILIKKFTDRAYLVAGARPEKINS